MTGRPDFDARYAEPGWAYGTEPNDFLCRWAASFPSGPVLCLGEGQGRNAVHLALSGHEVTAVDLSAVGLARAQALAKERGTSLTTIQADLATFEMGDAAWGGIVAIFCHLPSAIRRDIHRRIPGALAPGGLLLLESYALGQLGRGTGGPKQPDYLPSLKEIREDFGPLQLDLAQEIDREIHEGAYHQGVGRVIQVIARRVDAQPQKENA
jgi:SAM-dependent methyltransferase